MNPYIFITYLFIKLQIKEIRILFNIIIISSNVVEIIYIKIFGFIYKFIIMLILNSISINL